MVEIILLVAVVAALVYFSKSYRQYEESGLEPNKVVYESEYDELLHSEYGLIVALTAKVAKADGHVGELEAELISLMLNDVSSEYEHPEMMRARFKEIYTHEKESFENTIYLAQTFATLTKSSPQKVEKVIEHLMNLAFIDGVVTKQEGEILEDIAEAMAINPKVFHKLYDDFEAYYAQRKAAPPKKTIEDDYALLGVNASDDFSVIKKAYRKLVKENHPDIARGKGFGDDIVKEATEKLQEINSAYENIKKSRGL